MSRAHRFDEVVDAAVPRVLDEAMELAVERARDELAHRLAEAIVSRALSAEPPVRPSSTSGGTTGASGGAGTPPRPAGGAGAKQAGDEGTGLYAFAIVPARPVDLAGTPGLDGSAPLRVIRHEGLGLVVCEVPLGLLEEVSEDDLSETGMLATLARRHDDVVRAVFEHGPVLPLRFGTVVSDDLGAQRLLEEQAGPAGRRLAHLDTHREWGVRLSHEPAGDAEPQHHGADRRGMTGTAYLASRRAALEQAQRRERQVAARAEQVEQVLAEHAVDVTRRGGAPGSAVLADVAYLVPAAREDAFVAAVRRLEDDLSAEGMSLEATGPWPPYSFARLDEAAPSGPGVVGSA